MANELLTLLERLKPRTTLLLGASDTGKTTLLESLLRTWNSGERIGVVDCDVGQSHVGPPTTVAWGLLERPFTGWRQVQAQGMAFTGAVSPEAHVETFLDAVGRMAAEARRQAARLVIDTTGLVDGELGLALKRRKMDLLKPDLIVALQQEQELEPILSTVPEGTAVERLAVSPACIRRTLAARAVYRDRQLVRYFVTSVTHDVLFDRLRWVGLGAEWAGRTVPCATAALMDRAIGLRTAQGQEIALGLVRNVDPEQRRVAFLTPARDLAAVTTIAVGSIRWPDEGREPA